MTTRIAVAVVAAEGLQHSFSAPSYSGYRGVQPGMDEEAAVLVGAMAAAACWRKSLPVCNRTVS
jgi:hypothetical protein